MKSKRESVQFSDKAAFDQLKPNAEEEAVDVMVADVDWLDHDVIAFVRLKETIDMGLERANARFVMVLIGPLGNSTKHTEIAQALAALLQDKAMVDAAYDAPTARDLVRALNDHLHTIKIMPNAHIPTKKGVDKRKARILAEIHRLEGRELDQSEKWAERGKAITSFSVPNAILFAQKYALGLMLGILIALICANTDSKWYNEHLGPENYDSAVQWPTIFGLSFGGHGLTFNFVVNDILMALYFGLATKEIAEAFQVCLCPQVR